MILLVPISPEISQGQRPSQSQGVFLALMLVITYLLVFKTLETDSQYLLNLPDTVVESSQGTIGLTAEADAYLANRPLNTVAPTKASWDLARLLTANFIHGSVGHLVLNLIGAFAGARICSIFMPFAATFSIFLIGGSTGLLTSTLFSKEISPHIPHVGASGGIFALMGAYFVFNFLFRTRYFFWLPKRYGSLNLRTKTFFFIDVLLMELVLSAAQFMPTRVDTIDHLAHVVGFAVGVVLACALKFFSKWPWFLQTRAEYLYWRARPECANQPVIPFALDVWKAILSVNSYNDQVKLRLYELIRKHDNEVSDQQLAVVFSYMSPTFVRLNTACVASTVEHLMAKGRPLPQSWLRTLPYDSLIRIAKWFTEPVERQVLLLHLLSQYRDVHPNSGDLARKLELFSQRLSAALEQRANSA